MQRALASKTRMSRCVQARRPKTFRTQASPVSRRPFSIYAAMRRCSNACRRCYASLFTDRAISYRQAKGFDHVKVALSIGVQRMVRSDLGGAGVMFSIDTETGFDKVVLINATWGLGENVVQGTVDPDEYEIFKPFLSNTAVLPIIEKKLGEKSQKMIYTSDGDHPTRNVPTSRAERASIRIE